MKDHDLGKDYLVPGPAYRAVPSRDSLPGTEVNTYQHSKVQDALETAARAEGGLSLDGGSGPHIKDLEEDGIRSKYHHSVSVLKPIRSTSKHQHPVDNAGLFSFMTFSWLTPLAMRAHRKGRLLLDDVWPVSQWESCETNRRRLTGLWEEECRLKGDQASLGMVVWLFCRTRLLLSILCLMVTQLAGFTGPNPQGVPLNLRREIENEAGRDPGEKRRRDAYFCSLTDDQQTKHHCAWRPPPIRSVPCRKVRRHITRPKRIGTVAKYGVLDCYTPRAGNGPTEYWACISKLSFSSHKERPPWSLKTLMPLGFSGRTRQCQLRWCQY